jgi:hypothetical protein
MTVETYPDQLDPESQDVAIWRFLKMAKFRDLMATGELYFCRADLFKNDEREGLPPAKYLPALLGLNLLLLRDRQALDHQIGSIAQFRESFYISCWHLFRNETDKMWKEYGEDGVAICSRYRLLKSALDAMDDRAFLGLVRYGAKHLRGSNVFRFIMTKRVDYKDEQEVRATLWIMDPLAGINRHFDIDNRAHSLPLTPPPDRVLAGHRRRVDLQALITGIVVTPWASAATFDEVNRLATAMATPFLFSRLGLPVTVTHSLLQSHNRFPKHRLVRSRSAALRGCACHGAIRSEPQLRALDRAFLKPARELTGQRGPFLSGLRELSRYKQHLPLRPWEGRGEAGDSRALSQCPPHPPASASPSLSP